MIAMQNTEVMHYSFSMLSLLSGEDFCFSYGLYMAVLGFKLNTLGEDNLPLEIKQILHVLTGFRR